MHSVCRGESASNCLLFSIHHRRSALTPVVSAHSCDRPGAGAEGCSGWVDGAAASSPGRRHITATSYRWRSRCHRDRLSTPAAAPLRPPCVIQGGDFRPTGGGGFGLASEGTWRLSPSFPLPICLFLSLASRAWWCDECGYLGLPTPTHAALGTRACCVRRSGCEQGGLRVVLAVVPAYKHREKCCPDCAGRCAREAKQPALLLMYTVSHASPSHRRHTCLTPTRLLHHLCMVTPVVSGTKNAGSCNPCTHIANARGCTSPPP